MVINTPINPTNDPSYVNATRPISIPNDINPQGVEANRILSRGQEVGDRSAEYAGKALGFASQAAGESTQAFGDLFKGIVATGDFLGKAGVELVKRDIENEVYDVASAERERYTKILEGIRAGKNTQDILAGGGDGNTPSDIKDLPDQLSVLQAAKDGGKLRSTDYRARLAALAKDLRAKYPGFRQEIDNEFKKVTGMDPANSVVTGLIADINAQGHSAASQTNKLVTYIMGHQGDFNDPEEAIRKVQSGEWGINEIVRETAPIEKMRANIKDRLAVFNDSKLSDEARLLAGRKVIDETATAAVSKFVNKFMKEMGLETPEQAESMATRTKSGALSTQRWAELGQLFANGELGLRQSLWEDARKAGLVQKIGAPEVNSRIDAAMERVKVIKDRIYAADVGGLYSSAKLVKAIEDEDIKNALQDPVIGAPFRLTQMARKIGGDQWVSNTYLRQAAEGLQGKWEAYGRSMQEAIATQRDLETTGIPLTLNRVFDSYAEKMKDASPKEKATLVNSTINRIKSIADPDTPEAVKVNYAIAAFSPDRRSFITRLNQDSYDAKGRPVKGQNAVFQEMSSESMTKAMHDLGKKHPELWQMYTNWVSETLGSELISRDARSLDQIRGSDVSVDWDSDNHRFKFNYNWTVTGKYGDVMPRAQMSAEGVNVQRIVNRLNSNIEGYKNIAKVTGVDVDAFILESVARAVGPESLSRVGGIPADIIRSIGLGKLKKKGS